MGGCPAFSGLQTKLQVFFVQYEGLFANVNRDLAVVVQFGQQRTSIAVQQPLLEMWHQLSDTWTQPLEIRLDLVADVFVSLLRVSQFFDI